MVFRAVTFALGGIDLHDATGLVMQLQSADLGYIRRVLPRYGLNWGAGADGEVGAGGEFLSLASTPRVARWAPSQSRDGVVDWRTGSWSRGLRCW
jgi:hypothetical protein